MKRSEEGELIMDREVNIKKITKQDVDAAKRAWKLDRQVAATDPGEADRSNLQGQE